MGADLWDDAVRLIELIPDDGTGVGNIAPQKALGWKYLEVSTFEIKAANAINVQAVYEALAHRRAATHSYVLLHVPNDQAQQMEQYVVDVAEVARSHGIGVVTAAEAGDYETWEEREEARRVEPDPDRLNTFVATQLSESTRDLISRWLR